MINDRQEAQINAARAAKGKRAITTQIFRQNPTLPKGTDWLSFWTDYEMPGDRDPVVPNISEYVDEPEEAKAGKTVPRDAFASGVDGKQHNAAPSQDANAEQAEKADDKDDDQSYDDMTVDELKAEAEKRDLDHTGVKLKADWVKLLEDDDAEQE